MSRHPLLNSWTFWVINIQRQHYEIEPIKSFSTVEEFWDIYLNLQNAIKIKNGGLSLFKEGIKPAWEDKHNQGGHALSLYISDNDYDLFQKSILATAGGEIDEKTEKFCGLYIIDSGKKLSLNFWYSSGTSDQRAGLSEILGISETLFYLKQHK